MEDEILAVDRISIKYKETLERVAISCLEKVVFGEGDIKIAPFIQFSIGCYYDKCHKKPEGRNYRVEILEGSTKKEFYFHHSCFEKMIQERL